MFVEKSLKAKSCLEVHSVVFYINIKIQKTIGFVFSKSFLDEFDRFLQKRVEAVTKKETEVRFKLTQMHYKMPKDIIAKGQGINNFSFQEIAFSSDHDLKGIAEVYEVLKEKGIEIPMPSEEELQETDVGSWF